MFDVRWMTLNDFEPVLFLSIKVLRRDPRKTVTALQRRDKNSAIVVTKGDVVIGYMMYKHDHPEVVKIRHLCVLPEWQRKGAATAMMQFIMDGYSKAKVLKPLEVVVSELDTNNQKFFGSLGFKAFKVIKEHFKQSDGYVFRYSFERKTSKEQV